MGRPKRAGASALKVQYAAYNEAAVTFRTFCTRMNNGWEEEDAAMSELRIPKLAVLCSRDYARHDLAVATLESMVEGAKNRYDNFRILVASDDPLAETSILQDSDLRVEFLDFARITDRPKDAGPKALNKYMVEECSGSIVFWDGETSSRIRHFLELAKDAGLNIREYVY